MHIYKQAGVLFTLALGLTLCAQLAWAQDAPDLRAQAEAGLQQIFELQQNVQYSRGHFAGHDELEQCAEEFSPDPAVAEMLTGRNSEGIWYRVATSNDGRYFSAVASFGNPYQKLAIDETGVIQECEQYTEAAALVYAKELADYLEEREVWQKQAERLLRDRLHALQLGVERWSVDNSTKDGPNVYPLTLEPLAAEGYFPVGFYANPLTASSTADYNAVQTPLGRWSACDFSYYPHVGDNGEILGYMLAGYGCLKDGGIDFDQDGLGDGIVISLESGDRREDDWWAQALQEMKKNRQ